MSTENQPTVRSPLPTPTYPNELRIWQAPYGNTVRIWQIVALITSVVLMLLIIANVLVADYFGMSLLNALHNLAPANPYPTY